MSSRWKQAWAAIAVVGLVAAMAYGSSRGAEDAPPDTAEATLLAETMLEAFDVGDYGTFTAEFTDVFRESLKLSAFPEWRSPLIEVTGGFVALTNVKEPNEWDMDGGRWVFHAAFEADDSVQFAIVFKPGTHRINRVELKPDK